MIWLDCWYKIWTRQLLIKSYIGWLTKMTEGLKSINLLLSNTCISQPNTSFVQKLELRMLGSWQLPEAIVIFGLYRWDTYLSEKMMYFWTNLSGSQRKGLSTSKWNTRPCLWKINNPLEVPKKWWGKCLPTSVWCIHHLFHFLDKESFLVAIVARDSCYQYSNYFYQNYG